jgi:hypothetical protein
MSEGRAFEVLARFAASGRKVGNKLFLPVAKVHRLIAASTEAQLVVIRIYVEREGQGARVDDGLASIEAPDLTGATSWQATVFRANAGALAAVDRLSAAGGVVACAVELVGRAGYYSGRSHLPLEACADDELAWRIDALDVSLSAGAAVGVEPDAESLARLAALRAGLARRA